MFKYILLIFLSFFILACSNDVNDNTSSSATMTTQSLSITRAPSSTTPISIFQTLTVTVSQKLDATSVDDTTVLLKDSAGAIVGATVELNSPNNVEIKVTPFVYLSVSSTYTMVVTTGIKSETGASLSEDFELSFTTFDDGSITIETGQIDFVDINPNSSVDSELNTNISIEFNRHIAPSSSAMFSVTNTNDSSQVQGTFEYFNSRVTFTPTTSLLGGAQYEVNMINTPTDLFGNTYNEASGMTWSFVPGGGSTTEYGVSLQATLDTQKKSYLVRDFTFEGGGLGVAVARDGGVDIYFWDPDGFLFNLAYTVSIASEITDMTFAANLGRLVSGDGALLISTMNNGIYIITENASAIKAYNFIPSVSSLYGIGFSEEDNSVVDEIYAVGPNAGIKRFDAFSFDPADGSGVSALSDISVPNGSPLKVVGHPFGTSGQIYVTDYTQGLLELTKGGSLTPTVHDINGSVKHFTYTTGGDGNNLHISNSIGNVYDIDAVSPVSVTITASIKDEIIDMTHKTEKVFYSLGSKGVYIIDYYDSSTYLVETYRLTTSEDVISAMPFLDSTPQPVVTISKDGILKLYQ